jgi:hypothetical protein
MHEFIEQRIPGTQHYVKRFRQPSGDCAWCGTTRRTRFDYRGPGALDYRLDRPTHAFCNRQCYSAYWGN